MSQTTFSTFKVTFKDYLTPESHRRNEGNRRHDTHVAPEDVVVPTPYPYTGRLWGRGVEGQGIRGSEGWVGAGVGFYNQTCVINLELLDL